MGLGSGKTGADPGLVKTKARSWEIDPGAYDRDSPFPSPRVGRFGGLVEDASQRDCGEGVLGLGHEVSTQSQPMPWRKKRSVGMASEK